MAFFRLKGFTLFTLVVVAGCAGTGGDNKSQDVTDTLGAPLQEAIEAPAEPAPPPPPPPPPDPLRHRDDLPAHQQLLVVIDDEERIVDVEAAVADGYSVVDFSNGWAPTIFESHTDGEGKFLDNRYRRIYEGLANDRTDGDGRPLPDNEFNFLEVFGIPPSMGILRSRFVEDAQRACHQEIDYGLLATIDGLTYRNSARTRKHERTLRKYRKKIKRASTAEGTDDWTVLVEKRPQLEDAVAYLERDALEQKVLAEVEKRLDCDLHNHKRYKHKTGRLDHGLRLAVRRFQRKHKIYEYSQLRKTTMERIAQPPIQTNFLSLKRVLQERIAAATGILEDGSVALGRKAPSYVSVDGTRKQVRNLIDEFTTALMEQLNINTPESALAFFQRHDSTRFETLRVGVKFPKKPEYYGPEMDLKLVIDRGTIWYDLPWDENGKKRRQRRRKMPRAQLMLTYRDQTFPLVSWPTTIGGWRKEQANNGYVYMRYKGSDVGDRVIRQIIAGPVWIPPETTPLKSLVKNRYIGGKKRRVVNYEEMGPGYQSAYGLVAGYFVIPGYGGRGDVDRGIRAHGSSDYMSIMSSARFSHGCHRLMNHHAVRLYGFILDHRAHRVYGEQWMDYTRQFLRNEEVFQVRVPSRGFRYHLDPPLPVTVLEGDIRGTNKEPIDGYFKLPDEEYPAEIPLTATQKSEAEEAAKELNQGDEETP